MRIGTATNARVKSLKQRRMQQVSQLIRPRLPCRLSNLTSVPPKESEVTGDRCCRFRWFGESSLKQNGHSCLSRFIVMRLVARAQRVVSRFSVESRCDIRILPWNGGSKPRQLIRRPLLWPYPRPVLLRVPANPTLKHGAKRCRRIRGERQVVVVGLLLHA